jgi:ABC-type phosphate/phosphonate transport system substrate-binding protein
MPRYVNSLLLIILCWVILCSSTGSNAQAQTDQLKELIVAHPLKAFPEIDPKDAQAAFNSYATELGTGLGLKVTIRTYDTMDAAIDELQKGKVDLASLTSIEYLRIKNPAGIDLGLASVRGGKKTSVYLILTHVSRGYSKLSDLKNKKITILKGDDIGELFLNTTLLKAKIGEMHDFFSTIEEKTKASQIVLPVFFGQADACVVNDITFKTMVEMNPQLGKDLKVLMASPELLPGMGVFRKGLSPVFKERIVNVAKSLKNQGRGRQVLLLFKIDGLDAVKETDLTGVKDLYNDYERLKVRRYDK